MLQAKREVGLRFGGEFAVPDEGGASGLADIMRRHMTLQVFGGAAAHRSYVRAISCGSCGVFLGLQLTRIGAGGGGAAAAAAAGVQEEEEEELCTEEQAQSADGSSDVSLSVDSDVFLSEPSQHSKCSDFDLDFGYYPSETKKRQREYGECALRSNSLQVGDVMLCSNYLCVLGWGGRCVSPSHVLSCAACGCDVAVTGALVRGRERWCAQPHTLPHAISEAHTLPHASSEALSHSSDAGGDDEWSDVYLNGLLPSSYILGPERLQRLQMGAIGYTGVVRDVSCRRCTKLLGLQYLDDKSSGIARHRRFRFSLLADRLGLSDSFIGPS